MVLDDLPEDVRFLTDAFVRELDDILGDRFVGMFQYGAACFKPSLVADFDAHVIVAEPFTEDDRRRIWDMVDRLSSIPLGDDLDVWYVTIDAARSTESPQTELKPGFRDTSWALHRAHVHAGRYVNVKGPDPREIVPSPTWPDLDDALQKELRSIVADPHSPFGVLNLCRILYSYEALDVVVSKLQSAVWAWAALPVEHHPLIRTAVEAYRVKRYDLEGASEDAPAFYEQMLERIARARALAS